MTEPIEVVYDRNVAEEKLKVGTKYERLAAIVFKLLSEEDVVVHDLRLRGAGRTAVHQIDVSISRGGRTRRILVECRDKDAGHQVEQSDVRDFHGAVFQLGADGVIITTTGFTKGARNFADDEQISLGILRTFDDDRDWAGRLQRIELNITAVVPTDVGVRVIPINAQASELPPVGIDPRVVELRTASGQSLGSLADHVQTGLAKVPLNVAEGPIEVAVQLGQVVEARLNNHTVRFQEFVITGRARRISEKSSLGPGERTAELVLQMLDGTVNRVVFDDELQRYVIDTDGTVTKR